MEPINRKKIITLIEYGNDHSLRTHIRFGFKIYLDVLCMNIFGMFFHRERDISVQKSDMKKILIKKPKN